MPYINVDEAYILDNTGLQVDNSVDYANANANRNLLDNPWWGSGEIINQRGFSTATLSGNKYYFDRWMVTYSSSAGTITATANGIQATPATSDNVQFIQKFENTAQFNGKTVTFSMMLSDGTIYSGTITRTNGTAQVVFRTGDVGAIFQSDNTARFIAYGSMTIRAVKVELGSYSTLINDVPPDYGEELRKCMHYFQRIQQKNSYTADVGYGEMISSTTNARIFIPTAVPMRYVSTGIQATPTTTGNMYVFGGGSAFAATAVTGLGVTENGVVVNVTVSGTLTQNTLYGFRFTNNATYLDLSADL